MMRFNLVLILLLCFKLGFSQSNNTYASASGNEYWKNRKPYESYWQQDVHYSIEAIIDDKEELLKGSEVLIYYNNSPDTLKRVYFHLYQNAFTPESYAHNLRKTGKISTRFGEHEAKGNGTILHKVAVNGIEVTYLLDNTILIIELPNALLPNKNVEFKIDFTTFWDKQDGGNMRRRMKTFMHDSVTQFDGVHWYPRICVYDRKFGWTTDQHLGKEFYGDFGLFEVELTFPNHYIVEATGELINSSEVLPRELREAIDIKNYKASRSEMTVPVIPNGSTKTWKYRAVNVHDFAFTADPTYRIGEVSWNGIKCIALAQEQNAHNWQETANFVANVIKVYSEDIGMYGYPKIVAADARDGMEYPMITLNSGNWPGHQYVIAHEVGHNWFFGMIGNNETYCASLDEGFTQFLTAWSLKKINGQDKYNNAYDKSFVFNSYMNHAVNDNNGTLNVHSDHYNSADRHGGGYSQVYFKTATMLYNLQYVLGDELFSRAIKNYFQQYKYCHPYWEDFRASIIDFTKVDLNWFFDQWINTTKTIDYKILGVKQYKDSASTVKIRRNSSMQMPLDIEVEYADGTKEQHYIPNTYFSKKTDAVVHKAWIGWDELNKTYSFRTNSTKKVKDVTIDPTGRLADINRLNSSLKARTEFKFSKYRLSAEDYQKYQVKWHPNIWFNGIDGLKTGVDVVGKYYGNKHTFNSTLWYNTGIGARDSSQSSSLFSYRVDYSNRVGQLLDLNVDSRFLDGLIQNQIGLQKTIGKHVVEAYVKSSYRASNEDLSYLINSGLWNDNAWNNTLNLGWKRGFRHYNGDGSIQITSRGSFLWSDYNYARINADYKRNLTIKKLAIRSRLFAQLGTGDFAPESQLMLSGANNEELMDNPFTRSVGFVPTKWEGYGPNFNHFHFGGGLNLRGYAGYLATNDSPEQQAFFVYSGTSGVAMNMEIDFTNYIKLQRKAQNIKLNSYVFGDAGWLDNAGNGSDIRFDAGIGLMLTKRFKKYNYIKPITIRVDFPFFVNRLPANQSDYFAFRYVVGVSKAF